MDLMDQLPWILDLCCQYSQSDLGCLEDRLVQYCLLVRSVPVLCYRCNQCNRSDPLDRLGRRVDLLDPWYLLDRLDLRIDQLDL